MQARIKTCLPIFLNRSIKRKSNSKLFELVGKIAIMSTRWPLPFLFVVCCTITSEAEDRIDSRKRRVFIF
jgi:hypothetical protein